MVRQKKEIIEDLDDENIDLDQIEIDEDDIGEDDIDTEDLDDEDVDDDVDIMFKFNTNNHKIEDRKSVV